MKKALTFLFLTLLYVSFLKIAFPQQVKAQACSPITPDCPENNCRFDCADHPSVCDPLGCTPGDNTCICSPSSGSICQEDWRCEVQDPEFPDLGWCVPCDAGDCASYNESCEFIPCCFEGEILTCNSVTKLCDNIEGPTCYGHGTPCGEDSLDEDPLPCCDPYQCTANPYGEYNCRYPGEICDELVGDYPGDGCRDSCNEDDQRSLGQQDCLDGQECCVYDAPQPIMAAPPQAVFCVGNDPDVRTDITPLDPTNAKIATAIGCIPVGNNQAFIRFLLQWGAGIAGGIALILIVVAGIMFVTSAGDPKRMQAAKELLTAAISGLLLLIFGVFVLEFIGVDILNIPGFGN